MSILKRLSDDRRFCLLFFGGPFLFMLYIAVFGLMAWAFKFH